METDQDIKEKVSNEQHIDVSYIQLSEQVAEEVVDTFIVIPPDGGWGWVVVMAAFFSFLISDGVIYAFGVFLEDMSQTFHCSKSQVALTGALMTGFFCFIGPFASALVNQFGYRMVAITGSLIASTSCILTSISPSIQLTFLTHGVIGGIGFGLIYVPAVIAVGFYFERWRALATGMAVCGAGIGGIILPLILTILLNQIGWRCTFRIMAGLSFGCAFCGLLYKPLKPIRIQNADVQKKGKEQESTVTTNDKRSFFIRFHNVSHPTVADIHTKSHPVISNNHHPTIANIKTQSHPVIMDIYGKVHTTTADTVTTSTMTIFKPQKLAKNISSEFLMSALLSNYSTSSKGSLKSITEDKPENSLCFTKNVDSKLSTVYEETKEAKGRCRKLNIRWFCGRHNDSIVKQEERSSSCFFCKWCSCFSCSSCCTIGQNNENIVARPLYRDDIFYSASLMFLPEYRQSVLISQGKIPTTSFITSKSKSNLEYNMLVTRAMTQRELDEAKTCTLCSEPVKRTLATMLDLSLLKSPSFLLLTLHAVFITLGFYTPYMFIKDRAIQYGAPEHMAFWLISCIGFTNTFGRIACGIISSFSNICSFKMSYISLFIAGLITSLSGLYHNIWAQFGYAALYGLSVACMSALRTIIMVEMLGLEKLTNAIGIVLLFQGVASLAGISISGLLRDLTGNYEMSFYFAGGCICVGSLLLIPIRRVLTWEKRRNQEYNTNDNSKLSKT